MLTPLITLEIPDESVAELRRRLEAAGVGLNPLAERLLDRPDLAAGPVSLRLVALTPADLGFPAGATLPDVLRAIEAAGYGLCPLATGPYLRLAHAEAESPDPELHRQRPPNGALHVASTPLDPDPMVPKGFYLRTVEGRRWLRGYVCDDSYVVGPDVVYVVVDREPDGS